MNGRRKKKLVAENRYKNIFIFRLLFLYWPRVLPSSHLVLDSYGKIQSRYSDNEKSGHEKCVCTEMETVGNWTPIANKIYDIPNLFMIYNAM